MNLDSESEPKRSGGMRTLYIVAGVVALLFVLGALLWTPLRILYWKHGTLKPGHRSDSMVYCLVLKGLDDGKGKDVRLELGTWRAPRKLARVGPRAHPAIRELLSHSDVSVRDAMLGAIADARDPQSLPLIAEYMSQNMDSEGDFLKGVAVAEDQAGKQFLDRGQEWQQVSQRKGAMKAACEKFRSWIDEDGRVAPWDDGGPRFR